jgi:adenylate kinase family enzyme
MEKKMYIIMGRSGGGKGTQVDLFKKYLEGKGTEGVHHVTTGGGFRAFVQGDTFAAKQARLINDAGGLQPGFLAVWNWTNIFINELKEEETLILDGAPRKLMELELLKDAVPFFGFAHPTIIYLDVSKDWAIDKLTSRGRDDDKDVEAMERKMKWFDDDVYPCVEAYKNDPTYTFIHVNGEQTVEQVHQELVAKLEEAEKTY